MMKMKKGRFAQLIKNNKFFELFNDFGWNTDNLVFPEIDVSGCKYKLKSIAQKSGFRIFVCTNVNTIDIPNVETRHKIHNRLSLGSSAHIVIYLNKDENEQLWQFVFNMPGQAQQKSEITYKSDRDIEKLYEMTSGLIFEIDEEDNITIVDVIDKVKSNLLINNHKITKKFYEEFRKYHKKLISYITGIDNALDKDWYASVMLNRLMFCYFIQKRGFLDSDTNYLRNRMRNCRENLGSNQFYSFYKNFLMKLFHNGLGSTNHDADLLTLIGSVPYLNGGLFEIHEIEEKYQNINVLDEAFERIFDFFDHWDWHLDTSSYKSNGKEISPDVLGYIFEKYINERSKMGAFYTQEDITSYISNNCIVSNLLTKANLKCPEAFQTNGFLMKWIFQNWKSYSYYENFFDDFINLDDEIENHNQSNSEDLACRQSWNTRISSDGKQNLTYRELVDLYRQWKLLCQKFENFNEFDVSQIIQANLNLSSLLCDIISSTDNIEFVKTIYELTSTIKILDPTVGSGAFLFSSLNTLLPIVKACVSRFDEFLKGNESDTYIKEQAEFLLQKNDLERDYIFIKNIIINNLFGVDIMEEAIETAKLRLFLKLISCVEPNYNEFNMGIEPLPDIDFNIRCGNSLIGVSTQNEFRALLESSFDGFLSSDDLLEKNIELAKLHVEYKNIQKDWRNKQNEIHTLKQRIITAKAELSEKINRLIHISSDETIDFEHWLSSALPFNWYADFYQIIEVDKGFDVIVGNPPYLESKDVKYDISDYYKTKGSKAVHAYCVERSFSLINDNGFVGMILPLSIVSTQRMKPIQKLITEDKTTFISNYSWRPGRLFEEVNRALTIFISYKGQKNTFTTGYRKWYSEERSKLFDTLLYQKIEFSESVTWIPKCGCQTDLDLLNKLYEIPTRVFQFLAMSEHHLYYRTTGGLYFKVFTDFPPRFIRDGIEGSSTRETTISLQEKPWILSLAAILSSSTYWWWYTLTSNLRDLNPSDIRLFPINKEMLDSVDLQILGREYINDISENSTFQKRFQKAQNSETQTQQFVIKKSKHIIDKIDIVLGKYFGFSNYDVDYIINFDVKYRISDNDEIDIE